MGYTYFNLSFVYPGYTTGRIATSMLAKMAAGITYITVTMFAAECYPSIIRYVIQLAKLSKLITDVFDDILFINVFIRN